MSSFSTCTSWYLNVVSVWCDLGLCSQKESGREFNLIQNSLWVQVTTLIKTDKKRVMLVTLDTLVSDSTELTNHGNHGNHIHTLKWTQWLQQSNSIQLIPSLNCVLWIFCSDSVTILFITFIDRISGCCKEAESIRFSDLRIVSWWSWWLHGVIFGSCWSWSWGRWGWAPLNLRPWLSVRKR